MEEKYIDLDPIAAIRNDMAEYGWTVSNLSDWTGYRTNRIYEFLNKRRRLPQGFIRKYQAIPGAAPANVLIQEYELEDER